MLVYCDSVVLIYHLDHLGPLQVKTATKLQALHRRGDRIAVSDLTRFECRVGPIKRNDPLMLAAFDRFFASPDVHIVPLTPDVWDKAAEIRARLNLKTADSVHLAAAIVGRCGLFLTNDSQLSRCTEITVEALA